jgi:hypothetical protein
MVANPPVAGPGRYDDTDMRVVRSGNWYRDFSHAEPLGRSLTTSGDAGNELRFTFQGTKAALLFARGPSLGLAEILVDNEPKTMVDEYAASPVFGLRQSVDVPGGGVHTLAIRVAGRKNAASGGAEIAADGFEVWP